MPTIAGADAYFSRRLWTSEWDDSNAEKKKAALAHAQREVDSLSFSSRMSREDYSRAVFEQAIFLLNLGPEDRKRLNLQAQGVQSINISQSVSEAYILNGIAYAPTVQQLVKKYKYQVGNLI
ncbi:hypothetical protein SAMN04515654_12123 [Halanaerobium congolense]|uniref:Uncharacterized protein n=1 Tax=Halanaerobium congolense TaxID=54121 RepID=A0A1G8PTG1_9FIRM|nr:hypothetical protein [Halanaerobium congolense]SDI95784.1 hypothetical protein SAMN04515654_12123 [Halanaerobium congolense]SES90429.1 hypothetical protein SAMN04515653_10423 [Halanaerobium congolense]